MDEIELGSVADWLSAIGSVGAVVAALILANSQARRADRAERRAIQVEIDSKTRLVGEIHRLGRLAQAACVGLGEVMKGTRPADFDERFAGWIASMHVANTGARSLLAVVTNNPTATLILSDIERATDVPEKAQAIPWDKLRTTLAQRTEVLQLASEQAQRL